MTGAVPRRRWRASAAVLAAVLAATALAGCDTLSTSPVEEREFANPLAIPPLAPSTVQEGVRTFHLTAQRGTTEFPGIGEAETWGFDGSFLGPTLRASRGERVAVEVGNALDQPTSVHWHGMHLPAAMDGGPHQMVAPGENWRPTWTIGGTQWLAFDVLATGLAAVLAVLAVVAGIRGTRELVRLEGWAPAGRMERAPGERERVRLVDGEALSRV